MAAINRCYARSTKMNQIFTSIGLLPLLRERRITWIARYHSGEQMQHRLIRVDQASRPTVVDVTEMGLTDMMFKRVQD